MALALWRPEAPTGRSWPRYCPASRARGAKGKMGPDDQWDQRLQQLDARLDRLERKLNFIGGLVISGMCLGLLMIAFHFVDLEIPSDPKWLKLAAVLAIMIGFYWFAATLREDFYSRK